MKFKEYFQKDLERIGCSLSELSKASGLSSAVLSRYRSGEREPRRESVLLVQLCKGLDQLEQEAGLPPASQDRLAAYKDALNDDIILDYERFNQLLVKLGVSMKELSRALNYDASYLSRIRSGKRSPADPNQFAANVASYFIQNSSETGLQEIETILEEDDPVMLEYALASWLIRKQEPAAESIQTFLKTMDSFDLDTFIRGLNFEALSSSFLSGSSKLQFYHGTEEMRQGELDFFALNMKEQPAGDIFMCNDMPIEEMASDITFNKQWMNVILNCLKKGCRLNIIHDISRPFNEMMIGLQSWIPLYMTGQISPYYLPESSNPLYHHCLYVSDHASLIGECIQGSHEHGFYILSSDLKAITYAKTRADDILSHARPLMDIYRRTEAEKFIQFRDSEIMIPGDRTVTSSAPLFSLITDDLLKEILSSMNASEDLYQQITQMQIKELANLKASLSEGTLTLRIPEFTREEFEQHPPILTLGSMFIGAEIPYTWETYQKHMELTRKFAKTNDAFTLITDKHHAFRNITTYARKDHLVIVVKHRNPEIAFVISHPNMVNAFINFTAPVFEEN